MAISYTQSVANGKALGILLQNGFKVKNISGGMLARRHNYLLDIKKENNI